MNADELCAEFEGSRRIVRSIDDVIAGWITKDKCDVAEDIRGLEAFMATLVSDAAMGDGLLDEISPDVLAAFSARRGEAFDSYDEIREYLKEMLTRGDDSVQGVVSQIKGQLAELEFLHQAGGNAHLATSTNQEAWDVAIRHWTHTEYVQVKMYDSVDHAFSALKTVHAKVAAGQISDGNLAVTHVNFAVNEDIAEALRQKIAGHPELVDTKIYTIHDTDSHATGVVSDSFDHVGPEQLEHLFGEWLGSTVTNASLQAMVNAFLVYKGNKTFDSACAGTLLSTAYSAPAAMLSQGTAWLAAGSKIALISGHPVMAAIASGVVARTIIKQWYESRQSTADILMRETLHMQQLELSLSSHTRAV